MLHTGVVQTVHSRQRSRTGLFLVPDTGKRVAFHTDGGRSFVAGDLSHPFFHPSAPPEGELNEGDLVVFEVQESPFGPLAEPWGLYAYFRRHFERRFTSCLPAQAVEDHPYLLDVLIAGRRLFTAGRFNVQTEPFTKKLLSVRAFDDLIAFRLEYYFVAEHVDNGSWRVTELQSELICRRHKKKVHHPASTIGAQLRARKILLQPGKNILVRLSVDDRIGLTVSKNKPSPPEIAVQQRSLTIYV